ncbi:hypothetical protein BJ138DRAFT_1107201, partial [Hygrophoropsis aurantiaca]
MPKASNTQETPMARLAATRAAQKQVKNDDINSASQASESEKRPERKAMTKAKNKAVWLDTKAPTRKRAASSVPQPDKVKQPRKELQNDPDESHNVEAMRNVSQKQSDNDYDNIPAKLQSKVHKAASKRQHKLTNTVSDLPADADEGDDRADSEAGDSYKPDDSDRSEVLSGDDGLEVLEGKPSKLKEMLQKEIPHFSSVKHKPANNVSQRKSRSASRSGDDGISISSDVPSQWAHSRSSSAAVSDRSFATDPPSELEDTTHYRKRPAEIKQEKKRSTLGVPARSQKSKRALARDLEKPKWKDTASKDTASGFSDTIPSVDSDSDVQVGITLAAGSQLGKRGEAELQWPETSRLQYNHDGKVNLNSQKPHVQNILRESISGLHKYILFENAYPSYQDKPKITADILLAATEGA